MRKQGRSSIFIYLFIVTWFCIQRNDVTDAVKSPSIAEDEEGL